MKIDRQEILRYMGFRGGAAALTQDAREKLYDEVDQAVSVLQKACTPNSIFRTFPVHIGGPCPETCPGGTPEKADEGRSSTVQADPPDPLNRTRITIGPLTLYSNDLAKNLSGCTEAVILASTIGLGADRLVKAQGTRSLFRASLYQAAGAAMIEAYTDEVNERIAREAAARGLRAKPRFSPGYGDLDLSLQKDIFELLKLPKTLGLTLTESLLMVPTKSVTAFIGLMP